MKAAKPKTPYTGGPAQHTKMKHTKMKNPLKANDKVLVLTAIDVKVYQPNSERFFPYTAWSNCALSLQILGLISIKCKKRKRRVMHTQR